MARKADHKKDSGKEAAETKQLTFEAPAEQTAAPEAISEQQPELVVANETETAAPEEPPVEEAGEEPVEVAEQPAEAASVKAETHAGNRKSGRKPAPVLRQWQKILGLSAGVVTLVALVISGVSSQYFKNKTMPNVLVAGIGSTAKKPAQIKRQLEEQKGRLKISLTSGEKKFEPKLEEIGLQLDIDKTVAGAMEAKRKDGLFAKLAFWKKVNVPAVITVNDTLLNQYLETRLPELAKAPQDSQLKFNPNQAAFAITPQADGEGPDTKLLKQQFIAMGSTLESSPLKVAVAKKKPTITEAKLRPLLEPANELTRRQVILTGLGYTFRARPADIAAWLTPTPQKDGRVELVIDSAKVQSYIDSISKRISNAPVDRKVIKDQQTGAEVVIQEGRAGTELANRQALAGAITAALKNGQDAAQTMDITTAAFQTVNMEAYEKWIEVDLSEQRTTAYERATPVKNFLIASGTRGHETVTGEFAIWHKNRKQTMQGGSKADGSYYSIPNVEWVSYFYKDYALHGAWWREKFGAPASHGCVNMTNADAQWIFEWAPMGTKVIVHQ